MTWLLRWFILSLILLGLESWLPGIYVANFGVALIAALAIGLFNLIVKPILIILTLPINLLTLGLFSFLINAFVFWMASLFVPGFEVTDFVSALIASIILGLVAGLLPI
jgi:putative membrane protein